MMNKRSGNQLRILLLTRTGRPSGEKIFNALLMAKKNCVGVVAEKRTSLILRKGLSSLIGDSLNTYGTILIFQRMTELLRAPFKKNRVSVKELCRRGRVPYYVVENHNSEKTYEILKGFQADVLITANTRIVQKPILTSPSIAAINLHTSKLPQYAGLDSVFWALYNGEREIGVSIHTLEEVLDSGDIIVQETIPVMPDDDVGTLTEKATDLGAQLVIKALDKFERGDFAGFPQDNEQRSYFSWPTPAQRKELRRLIRQRSNANYAR
jgi:methionyl-tRNA formyltransferase